MDVRASNRWMSEPATDGCQSQQPMPCPVRSIPPFEADDWNGFYKTIEQSNQRK